MLRILLLGYSFVKIVLDIAEYEPTRGMADIFRLRLLFSHSNDVAEAGETSAAVMNMFA